MAKPRLTVAVLQREAGRFALRESRHADPSLYGVTDGKAVGTYLEQKFRQEIGSRYVVAEGNTARGIDFPELDVDIKVTSARQPQSSCPFHSARQKIFGLGYSLLVFVYDKSDDHRKRTSRLQIQHTVFVEAEATGDYTTTRRLREMIADGASDEDVFAYLVDRNLPLEEVEVRQLAIEILKSIPKQGYLTISNALQWRLQYGHAIRDAGTTPHVLRLS